MLNIEFITIFPNLFLEFLQTGLIGRAIKDNILSATVTNLRDFADPPHFKVDDEIYGGGPGMLLKPEPLAAAISAAKQRHPQAKVILLTPSGQVFSQQLAKQMHSYEALIFICGRYEGVDQRVIDLYVDVELSIGDYVLMGGELPAMVVTEAIARLQESVVGNQKSVLEDSFSSTPQGTLLEGPQFTRPPEFSGHKVPDILLSGDHKKIAAWQKEQSLKKTKKVRPNLICEKQE